MDITQTMRLVRLAQDGDKESLNRLVERYFDRVRTVVRTRIGAQLRRWHDSCDVAQQTFLVALRNLDDFEMRDESALISWLATIAENQIRNLYARAHAGKRDAGRDVALDSLGNVDEDSNEPGIAGDGTGPVDAASDNEEQQILEDALAELPEELRELILLRDYVGHTWPEIAERTGRPSADAARMKYHTARAELAVRVKRRLRGE